MEREAALRPEISLACLANHGLDNNTVIDRTERTRRCHRRRCTTLLLLLDACCSRESSYSSPLQRRDEPAAPPPYPLFAFFTPRLSILLFSLCGLIAFVRGFITFLSILPHGMLSRIRKNSLRCKWSNFCCK